LNHSYRKHTHVGAVVVGLLKIGLVYCEPRIVKDVFLEEGLDVDQQTLQEFLFVDNVGAA
jgi:hypothetical protein